MTWYQKKLTQKQELIKEIEKEVIDLLKEFSNTPLDKRGTGWDWLIKVKSILNLLEERSET